MCVNLLSLSSVALTWPHCLPALSSTQEIIYHWAVVMYDFLHVRFSLVICIHIFTTGKDSCRMDKGDDLSWGALARHFLPPHFQTTFCCCLLHLTDFLPVGHSARLNCTAQCFSVLPCLMSSLPACLRTEVCLRLTASGRWILYQPAYSIWATKQLHFFF